MREQLAHDAHRLDQIAALAGWQTIGGTSLFRLYQMTDARYWQEHLARQRIWARSFSYNDEWLRLGLPPASGWDRLQQAIIR
jgi:cobalamin biosynthetic protein CobC